MPLIAIAAPPPLNPFTATSLDISGGAEFGSGQAAFDSAGKLSFPAATGSNSQYTIAINGPGGYYPLGIMNSGGNGYFVFSEVGNAININVTNMGADTVWTQLGSSRALVVAGDGGTVGYNKLRVEAPASQTVSIFKVLAGATPGAGAYLMEGLDDAVGTGQTIGLALRNTTAATTGPNNKYSPTAMFEGRVWNGSASKEVSLAWQMRPNTTMGYSDRWGDMVLWRRYDGGSWQESWCIDPSGLIKADAPGIYNSTYQSGIQINSGNNATYIIGNSLPYLSLSDYNAGNLVRLEARASYGFWLEAKTSILAFTRASDGASARCLTVNTDLTWSNASARLFEVQNNTVDKFYVKADGTVVNPTSWYQTANGNAGGYYNNSVTAGIICGYSDHAVSVYGGALAPYFNNIDGYDLGTTSHRWKKAYINKVFSDALPSFTDMALDGISVTDAAGDFTNGDMIVPMRKGMYLKGFYFYWPGGHGALTNKCALWEVSGGTLVTSVNVNVNAAGVYTAEFGSPQLLTAGKAYILTTYETSGAREIYITNAQFSTWSDGTVVTADFNSKDFAPGYKRIKSLYVAGDAYPTSSDTSDVLGIIDPIFA